MNVRKPIDYSAMFTALDTLMATEMPQVELYSAIGRLVSARPEKGAAVAAAEYLCGTYPDASGFSPRNLRRMREFYRAYERAPEVLAQAMTINWTQNVVILEEKLTLREREWYIRAAGQFGWSKLELQRQIIAEAHLEIALDFTDEMCYTGEKNCITECTANDENSLYLPRQDVRNPPKPLKINGFEPLSVSTLPTFYQQQRANGYNTPKHPLRRLSPSRWVLFMPSPFFFPPPLLLNDCKKIRRAEGCIMGLR